MIIKILQAIPLFQAVAASMDNNTPTKNLTTYSRKTSIESNTKYVVLEVMRRLINNDIKIKILGSCE